MERWDSGRAEQCVSCGERWTWRPGKYAGCEKGQMPMVIMWMSTGQWGGVQQSGA